MAPVTGYCTTRQIEIHAASFLVLKVSCSIYNCGPLKFGKMTRFIVFHEFRHGRIFSGCSPVNSLYGISADNVTCWRSYQHFGFDLVYVVVLAGRFEISLTLLRFIIRIDNTRHFFCGSLFNKNYLHSTVKHFFVITRKNKCSHYITLCCGTRSDSWNVYCDLML